MRVKSVVAVEFIIKQMPFFVSFIPSSLHRTILGYWACIEVLKIQPPCDIFEGFTLVKEIVLIMYIQLVVLPN